MTDRTSIVSSWRPGLASIALTEASTSRTTPMVSNVGAATEDASAPATPRSRSIVVV